MELLEGMLQKEKDEFKRICNRLLGTCFLCKADKADRTDYYFVLQYKKQFDQYLNLLGYRLEISEEHGVIQLTTPHNYNHINMKLFDSIILLILRILYDEKKRELSLSDEVIVTLGDIQDKFASLQIREKIIDKTTMRNACQMFQRYHLVETLDKDYGSQDTRILIYDTILMAIRVEDIKQAYDKVMLYRKGRSEDEETDAN